MRGEADFSVRKQGYIFAVFTCRFLSAFHFRPTSISLYESRKGKNGDAQRGKHVSDGEANFDTPASVTCTQMAHQQMSARLRV